MSVTSGIGPTDPQTRFASADAIRGIALFGVLLVNMYNFGAYSPEWTGTIDRAFNVMMHGLFETKSLRLFSLLFGFGFALQLARVMSTTTGSMWIYVRRMVVLFIIGMAHALLFDGDILMEYSILGLILVAFRNVPRPALLVLAVALLAVFPVVNLFYTPSNYELAMQVEDALPPEVLRMGHPYLGSAAEVFRENAAVIPPRVWSNLHDPESGLAIFAMFLLGLYVGRAKNIADITARLPMVRKVFAIGIGIGSVSALIEWWLTNAFGYSVYAEGTASETVTFLGDMLFAYGSTALALGYGAGIVLLLQKPTWETVLRPFENMGRMALTIYLSGTLMFTTLFYGYGFGQLFLLGPAATTAYATLFFTTLLLFCNWWLSRFRFGPAEWLWRSLTYWKIQPMRL
jgi:uncharacterized protein